MERREAVEFINTSPSDPESLPDPNPKAGTVNSGSQVDKAQLESYIVRELSKQTKPSDIALYLCEVAGMEYTQAQKLISRTAVQHHKRIISRQNWIIIPLTIIATFAGLVLLSAGAIEAFTMRFLISRPSALTPEQILQAYDKGPELIWAFTTGSILLIGGLVGFVSALRKQLG